MKKSSISHAGFLPAAVAIFISALFCLNFYLFISFRTTLKENKNQQAMIHALQKEKEALESKLSVRKEDVEYYRQQKELLDKMLEKQKVRPKKKKPAKNRDVKV